MVKKESTGLFLQNGRNEKNTTLYIKSVAEGIKTLSDWDFAANSMQCSNKERFESDFSNSLLGHEWSAEKILIKDDVAAISYPEYTDMNKVVIQETLGGLYAPLISNYNSYSSTKTTPIKKFVLPRINKSKAPITDSNERDMGRILDHENVNLESLFIIVEYDGYITDPNSGNTIYDSVLDGETEIFTYKAGAASSQGVRSYYTFDNDIDYPVLHSRFFESYGKTVNLNISTNTFNARTTTVGVGIDVSRLSTVRQQLSSSTAVPQQNISFSFIGCKRITYIKYTPVVKCGRVDIYKKLSGTINSVLSNGRVTSTNHNLIDGNAINIAGARNKNGKDLNLNGIKYVQVVDSNTLDLYDDSGMTKKTYTVSGSNPDASWIAVGNVYSETLPEGWNYVKTLTSPYGRNGYLSAKNPINIGTVYQTPNISGQSDQTPIRKIPKEISNDYFLLLLYDVYKINASASYPANVKEILARTNPSSGNNLFTKTPYDSSLGSLWASESTFIQGCLFGSDIDLKTASDGSLYLAVGERGSVSPENTVEKTRLYGIDVPFLYPHYSPFGKVHLLKIEKTSTGVLDSYVRTIHAFDEDASITQPEHISNYNFYANPVKDFYEIGPLNNSEYLQYNQFFAGKNSISDSFLYNDYWYGSLLYSLKDYDHIPSQILGFSPGGYIYDKYLNGGFPFTSVYFSNFGTPVFEFSTDPENPFGNNYVLSGLNQIYPYCDSFGKSVALNIESGDFVIAASSRTKTKLYPNSGSVDYRKRPDLIPRPYDAQYSNLDCGYVHIYRIDNTLLTKYNKISHTSSNSRSGSIDTLIDKAERYAKTILFHENNIVFGSSRASEFYDKRKQRLDGQVVGTTYSYPSTFNDVSSIYFYKESGASFVLQESISNNSDIARFYSFNTGKTYNIDHYNQVNAKECILKNKILNSNYRLSKYTHITGDGVLDYTTSDLDCIVFPSDRFGDYFSIEKNVLCTNSLDWYNEVGLRHADYTDFENDPRLKLDYVHTWNKIKDNWTYISKLTASFDSNDSRYSYVGSTCDSTLLRDVGNYNYSNKNFNSKSWDYDLTKSYAVIDQRIVLKDPVGYSIFRRSSDLNSASGSTVQVENQCYPYFKFDEVFYANYDKGLINPTCNFYHTKYGSLYKYNAGSIIKNTYSEDLSEIAHTTPVFFISIPKNSGENLNTSATIKISIESDSLNFPKNLGLKLYKKDPRLEVDAVYKNNFTYNCAQGDPDLLYSDYDPTTESIFTEGALSDYSSEVLYSNNYITLGKIRTYTFTVRGSVLQEYTLENSQLKNTTIFSNGESLALSDTSKATYNSSIVINNTLMMGLVSENKNYALFNKGVNVFYTLKNLEVSVFSQKLTNSYYNTRTYTCVYDKLLYYHSPASSYYCDTISKRRLSTVLGVGYSDTISSNCNNLGDISSAINILASDNYYGSFSTDSLSGNNFSLLKSSDINELKYLPLFIASNYYLENNTSLFSFGAFGVSDNANLNIKSAVTIDNNISLFFGPTKYTNNISLFEKVSNFIPEPLSGTKTLAANLFALGSVKVGTLSSNDISLSIKTVDSASVSDLFILGPVPTEGSANLNIKASQYVGVSLCEAPSLFTFGSYKHSSNINLIQSGNNPENISLFVNGPSQVINNTNLFIDSKTQGINQNIGLVCHQKPNGNISLYTSAPSPTIGYSTLFIDYSPKNINSISNGSLTTCNLLKNTEIFHADIFEKESLIYGTNSIVDKIYSENITDFGYRFANIPLEDIKTDYEFYRFGRSQSLVDYNATKLVIAYLNNKFPAFKIYNIQNKQLSSSKTVLVKSNLPVGIINGDSYIQDIKISDSGYIAISYYIEVKNSLGAISGGAFYVSIFDSNGLLVKEHSREFTGFSEELFLSNCMGLSVAFHGDNLFYTKEDGYDTILIKCDSPSYLPVEKDSFFQNFLGADKNIVEKNIIKGYVPYNRSAFGHKIEITDNNNVLISAPLFNRYLLIEQTEIVGGGSGGGGAGAGVGI